MKRSALLHTTPVTLEIFQKHLNLIPDIEIVNMMDDGILKDVMKIGGVNENINKRVMYFLRLAEEADCMAFIIACSSIGECVSYCQPKSSIPVMRIDEAMAEKAVDKGPRIAVMATVNTTLEPTANLINKTAQSKGRNIKVTHCLVDGAYEALTKKNTEKHNSLVKDKLLEAAENHDVIVLAQASMSTLSDELGELKTPVLSSPRLGILKLKEMVCSK